MTDAEESFDRRLARYPTADITPAELEEWVADVLRSVGTDDQIAELDVRLHDRLRGRDGEYDIDATVRFRSLGLDFLVLVEVKQHRNPIKREVVQLLHSKVTSVGAHKGVIFSTSPFQRGALDYAKSHGIALVVVTEGRFTIERRGASELAPVSREEAAAWGVDPIAGVYYGPGGQPGSTVCVDIGIDRPDLILEYVFGCLRQRRHGLPGWPAR